MKWFRHVESLSAGLLSKRLFESDLGWKEESIKADMYDFARHSQKACNPRSKTLSDEKVLCKDR